jgi:hypothetical protein
MPLDLATLPSTAASHATPAIPVNRGDDAFLDPFIAFERLLTDSDRRLAEIEHACAQDQLSPALVEASLVRLAAEAMRALLAQAQVLTRAAKVPMTPDLRAAITELGEHAAHIATQANALEDQRRLDQLTDQQRQAARTRAFAAHTRLLKANALLAVTLARDADLHADADTDATALQGQDILAAGAALLARSRQLLEELHAEPPSPTPPAGVHNGHAASAPISIAPTANGQGTNSFTPHTSAPTTMASTHNDSTARAEGSSPANPPGSSHPTQRPAHKATSKQSKKKGKAAGKPHRKR